MVNALFICTANRLRSPTAEQVFSTWAGVETDFAGLGADAEVRLSPEQIEWADIIFVMETVHRSKLGRGFGRISRTSASSCSGYRTTMPSWRRSSSRALKRRPGAT